MPRPSLVRVAAATTLGVMCLLATAQPQTGVVHATDFESDTPGGPPTGWTLAPTAAGYELTVVDAEAGEGERCMLLGRNGGGAAEWAPAMQAINAERFRGKRVRYSALVRTDATGEERTQLWMRVDRPNNQPGFFDNMFDRPIRSPEWARFSIVGDVADDALAITIGVLVHRTSNTWIDDVKIEVIGDRGAGDVPPAPLSPRGLVNVRAFTELLGVVEHFHPTNAAMLVDWQAFGTGVIPSIEAANDNVALAEGLDAAFEPIAPSVQVWVGDRGGMPPDTPLLDSEATVVSYVHVGLGPDKQGTRSSVYSTWREEHRAGASADELRSPPFPSVWEGEIAPGVWARVPLALPRDDDARNPELPSDWNPLFGKPEGWRPSAADRSSRLVAIGRAWAALEHFYPYFDVVNVDWQALLGSSLQGAASAADAEEFTRTVQRLVAALDDGHGRVVGVGAAPSFQIPALVEWVGEDLAVVYALVADLKRGDVIEAIDGVPAADIRDQWAPLVSASTEGWMRFRTAALVISTQSSETVSVTTRSPDGHRSVVQVQPVAANAAPLRAPRPANGEELAPGVVYFDLNAATNAQLRDALPALQGASGIVFDMRGYPNDAATTVLRYLTDAPIHSAWWNIPVVRYPQQRGVTFDRSHWTLPPMQPGLTRNVAFVIDGRAISYAESIMGIVEHYKLGEIVGEPTAGANGNVNTINCLGLHIAFTGMKVTKHDDSQHHGVGILPTAPASRTIEGLAAGRDEMLDRAVEVVSARIASGEGEED